MQNILAIDPGNLASAWVLMERDTMKPIRFAKEDNLEARQSVLDICTTYTGIEVAIEMIASYGMSVGREVFDTCVEIGRFEQIAETWGAEVSRIYRREEKMRICGSQRANDATIRQALADRFAYGTPNFGKGSKQSPGWFYGFRADIWQAYAVGVTYLDKMREQKEAFR